MKVLHVAQKLPGGPASYLGEVLPYQLSRLGRDNVRLVACGSELGHLPHFPGDAVHTFDNSGRGPNALAQFALKTMAAIRDERPDVVHLHSTFPGMLRPLMAAIPAKRRPKVIYCSHGWAFNMQTSDWRKRTYALIERLLEPFAQRTIAISPFEERSAIARGISSRRLVVVENGIDAGVPEIPEAPVRFSPDVINLLFIGRLDRQKGFDVLHDAMDLMRGAPVHLHVIGESVVSSSTKTFEARPNITYHGWQPRNMVPGFLDQADAVVMPSRWEGFGLVAIEAMRQGRPVLASRVDALPDVVGECGILFPPENPIALAEVIIGLDRDRLRELGAGARERFVRLFTSERMNRQIIQCYEEALGAP